MKYLLDTNICIYLIKGRMPSIRAWMDDLRPGDLGVSAITVAELAFGCQKSQQPKANREALRLFLLPLEVLAFGEAAAEAYGQIRARLERAGTPIGGMDLLIAAQAMAGGHCLVTNNTREFCRVPGLALENWVDERGHP